MKDLEDKEVIKNLEDREVVYVEAYYSRLRELLGHDFDDTKSPYPWGCPWLFEDQEEWAHYLLGSSEADITKTAENNACDDHKEIQAHLEEEALHRWGI